MARRFFSGSCQLALALAGFGLLTGAIFELFYKMTLAELAEPVPQTSTAWMWNWGAALFGAGWLWSVVTSAGILWQAKKDNRNIPNIPPKL